MDPISQDILTRILRGETVDLRIDVARQNVSRGIERRLQQVRSIHRSAAGCTSTDDRVDFVNEQKGAALVPPRVCGKEGLQVRRPDNH